MKHFFYFTFFSLLIFCSIISCSGSKNLAKRPQEMYNDIKMDTILSVINIPFELKADELEKIINQNVQGVLFKDDAVTDNTGAKMDITCTKSNNIKANFDGQTLNYKVPIFVKIKKNIGLMDLNADGELVLNFSTLLSFQNDWSIKAKTKLNNYAWSKTPAIKMAGYALPITWIADYALKKSEQTILDAIDKSLNEKLMLRETMSDLWSKIQQPQQLNSEYNLWLQILPQQINLAPIKNDKSKIFSTITINTIVDTYFGENPIKPATNSLPQLNYNKTDANDFTFNCYTSVPFGEAEKLASKFLKGQTFSDKKRTVKIEDIKLFGQGSKIVVDVKLSGSYDGRIYFVGVPYFNEEKNAVAIKDLEFELDTKNVLLRTANWLFSKTLTTLIQKNMVFPLDENLNSVKIEIQNQLNYYEISKGLVLKGKLSSFDLKKLYLEKDKIKLLFNAKGNLGLTVSSMF